MSAHWNLPTRPRTGDAVQEHSYVASSADLMIGLLFVFIIMVAFLALQKRNEQAASAAKVLALLEGLGEDVLDPRGDVTRRIGSAIGAALGKEIRIDPKTGVISLPEDVLFERGKGILKPDASDRLRQIAGPLGDVLRCYVANARATPDCKVRNPREVEIETIFIEGHTDVTPMLAPGGNLQLSFDRARAMSDALVRDSSLAVFRNGLDQPVFSYSAYGDARLLKNVPPTDGRNRRVDLRVVLSYRPPQILSASTAAP